MDFAASLDKYFTKVANKTDAPTQVGVYSPGNDIAYEFSSANVNPNQPFHVASVGKLITATVVYMLIEQGKLRATDTIEPILGEATLDSLFVYKGVDYKSSVTVEHLITHTSGVADYFESTPAAGSSFVDMLFERPNTMWTPTMLLDFTRTNLQALSAPGPYAYSDTGYILLGLVIEKVTGKSLAEVQAERIFNPCGMDDSYLLFYGEPKNGKKAIAPVYFNGIDISELTLLSCDWAGGGVVSTLQDLQKFQIALWSRKLVSDETLATMQKFNHKFRAGMYYSAGMMQLRFEGFFFLLRGLMRPNGHTGILGTHMYYDAPTDTHVIINFGSNKRMVDSIKAFIFIAQHIKKQQKKL